MIEFADSIVS